MSPVVPLDGSFRAIADGGAALSALNPEDFARFRPIAGALSRGPGRWDHTQHGPELDFNQSDCNWFAFEARAVDTRHRYSGILALHRTGPRLASFGDGFAGAAASEAPRALQSALRSPLAAWLPVRPRFDPRPLFLSVLYDLDGSTRPALCHETAVQGELDDARFSFVSDDRRQQMVHGEASEFRGSLPPVLEAFFGYEGPAFALRTCTERFELELFLRPEKDPVAYGLGGAPALHNGKTVFHYVQRPRLEAIGRLRQRTARGVWGAPVVLRGDATQDRHWLTLSEARLRWLWLMARLDDGREIMAFEMRTADGGRWAPADAGTAVGGGAWIVEASGEARPIARWTLAPEGHVKTPRGLLPTRFRLTLPEENLRLLVEHERATFVPTRALGELFEAGIWESPARVIESEGVSGGRFWVDVMPPYGGL